MSKAAPAPIATGPVQLSAFIKAEHEYLESAYQSILGAGTEDERLRWRNQFVWELARYAVGEELVMLPVFEKTLPNGLGVANSARGVLGEIKDDLYTFQNEAPSSSTFRSTLDGLMEKLRAHMNELEGHDIAVLEGKIEPRESEKMVMQLKRTSLFTPTRSHPGRRMSGPDRPPFESVFQLLTAPVDHLSDVFRKFPAASPKSPLSA